MGVGQLDRITVEPISAPEELTNTGLHWFRIDFGGGGEGHCVITKGEALRLSQLDSAWVEQALLNLRTKYGHEWLERAARESPGLVLHYLDA